MDPIRFIKVPFENQQLIDQVRRIYETSFRDDIRVPWEYLLCEFELARIREKLKKRNNEKYHLIGALSEGRLVAFFISKYLRDFTYATYMAIEESYRNRAIGTSMGWKLIEMAKKDAEEFQIKDSVLLFEVEKPENAPNNEIKIELEKRIQFYQKKFNALYLDLQYIQPLATEDGIEMYLVVISLSKKNFIESDRLLRSIRLIYQLEYHVSPHHNASKYERNFKIIINSIKNRKKIFGIANL